VASGQGHLCQKVKAAGDVADVATALASAIHAGAKPWGLAESPAPVRAAIKKAMHWD
jgi:hypothetical protein